MTEPLYLMPWSTMFPLGISSATIGIEDDLGVVRDAVPRTAVDGRERLRVDDRLVLAFLAELRRRGVERAGGKLLATSMIPVARGLGSSAAATVAGIALATAACGDTLDRDAALASTLEPYAG